MENATSWSTWLAYGAIVTFLLFVLALMLRTLFLFSLLWLSPAARVLRRMGLRRNERHTDDR